jgi:hypothetical protein
MEGGACPRLSQWLVAAIALNVLALTSGSALPMETLPKSTMEAPGMAGNWLSNPAGHYSTAPSNQLRLEPLRQVAASSLPAVGPRTDRLTRSRWRPGLIDWGGGSFLIRASSPVRAPPS